MTDNGITGLFTQPVTLRQYARTSAAGNSVRIRLSNVYSSKPLDIGSANVALRDDTSSEGSAIQPGTLHVVTFNGGSRSVQIPAGAVIESDPVAMSLTSEADLLVSMYFPYSPNLEDIHAYEGGNPTTAVPEISYLVAGGDVTANTALNPAQYTQVPSKYILTGVDITPAATIRTMVAFGDSITDHAHVSAPNKDYPSQLGAIMNSSDAASGLAVGNAGISGNELLVDQPATPTNGQAGISRFKRDVLDRPGVTDVVVLEGTNDLHKGFSNWTTDPNAVADNTAQLIAGYRNLISQAHQHSIRIYGGTIMPVGSWYNNTQADSARQAVNAWIRTSNEFDGVVDFDLATRDPSNPSVLAAGCGSNDGIHPTDPGTLVMANLTASVVFNRKTDPKLLSCSGTS